MKKTKIYLVEPSGDESVRIDMLLAGKWTEISRNRIQKFIRNGDIRVNGKKVKPGYKPVPGDEIILSFPENNSEYDSPRAEDIDIGIIYSDDHIAVVNKPAGLVVHPSRGHLSGTLVNALLWKFPEMKECGASGRPGIVHRLDRGTSGVMVVALTPEAHTSLGDQFRARTVEKAYDAIVWGIPDDLTGEINLPIGRHQSVRTKMSVWGAGARSAETFFKLESGCSWMSRLKVIPRTGRTHQIRVHLAYSGLPIVGDAEYGENIPDLGETPADIRGVLLAPAMTLKRPALHAASIAFDHPVTGKRLRFESPWPEDFSNLAAAVEKVSVMEKGERK